MVIVKLCGLKSVGCAYKNGQRMPGWGEATLSNGRIIYFAEQNNSFNSMVESCERQGIDCEDYKKRLDKWVETGEMPGVSSEG